MFKNNFFTALGLCLLAYGPSAHSEDLVPERANPAITTVNHGDFDIFIKSGFSLIDFYADWCVPCKKLTPIFRDLAKQYSGSVRFGKINIDLAKSIAERKTVKQIPTMILFKDGQEIKRRGPGTKSEIAAWIDAAIADHQ